MKYQGLQRHKTIGNFLEDNTVKAVIACADEYGGNEISSSESDVQINDLLQFDNLFSSISDLLNYVLVRWTESPYDMVSTEDGQVLLRQFAKEGLIKFVAALKSLDEPKTFRVLLHEVWMHKARLFYDGRDGVEFQYPPHRFTSDGRITIDGDLRSFFNRKMTTLKTATRLRR